MLFIWEMNISNVKSNIINKELLCNSHIEFYVIVISKELICNRYFIKVTNNS